MQRKRSLQEWVKAHKKQLLIGAGTGLIIAGGYIIFHDRNSAGATAVLLNPITDSTPELLDEAAEIAEDFLTIADEPIQVIREIDRRGYVRQLHEGWKASPEKIKQALALGIKLKPGQTLVDSTTVTLKQTAA